MNHPVSKKLQPVYFQNLDAARFIAAFAVFLLHFSNELKGIYPSLETSFTFKMVYTVTSKGGLGVNFFFVLSGFLITYLILTERNNTGSFHLVKFLIRRTLRIWPLYFLIGLIGFVLFPLIFSDYATLHEPLNYFFFLANFDEIWHGANDPINFLTAPWSVAVEEQFYLFWGVLFFALGKFKKHIPFPYILVVLYGCTFAFRIVYWTNETVIYHHTLSVCQDILMGAFIGWSVFKRAKWIKKIQHLPKFLVHTFYIFGLLLCLGKNKFFADELVIIERFVLSFFFGFVILNQIGGSYSIIKFGKIKGFTALGKISYGIYMYHLVVMFVLMRYIPFSTFSIPVTVILYFLLSVGLTFLISQFSYRYFELKFLSLKPKHTKP